MSQLTLSGPFMPCGDLSVFVISGGADNIQGDASDPIRLLYSKQYGVIYIGGKGKIFSIRDHALGDLIFQAHHTVRKLCGTGYAARVFRVAVGTQRSMTPA